MIGAVRIVTRPAGRSLVLPRGLPLLLRRYNPRVDTSRVACPVARRPFVLRVLSPAGHSSFCDYEFGRDDGFCGTEVVESFLGKPRSVRSRQPAEQSTRGLSPRLQLRPR